MSGEERRAIYIEGNRDCYSPSQKEHRTMTVAEMIDCLTEMGEAYGMDARVFIRNDYGYTFGSIDWDDFTEGGYDDDASWIGDVRYDDEY